MQKEWKTLVNHRSDLLTQDLILSGIRYHSNFKEFGYPFDYPYLRYIHSTGDIQWSKDRLEYVEKNHLIDDQYEQLIKYFERSLSEYRSYLKTFKEKIEKSHVAPGLVDEYFQRSIQAAGTIPRFIFEIQLGQKLEDEGFSPSQVAGSETDISRAAKELAEIGKKYNAYDLSVSEEMVSELQKVIDRYGYLGMKYFQGRSWCIWEAYQMAVDLSSSDDHQGNDQQTVDSQYARYLESLMRLRTEKWETMCYGTYLFRKMVIDHYSDIVHYDDLLSLRMKDVVDLFKKEFPSRSVFYERESFILEITDQGVELKSEDKQNKEEERNEEVKEIKGQIANKGKVRGKVRVVLSPKECSKIEKGDILVATMSTPDFLSGMAKAAAFVTDIGGITSHAAIVSREMNKPCVIGTQHATQILKDGDEVEVDADEGVVRILNT
ncbi:MAG: PEP-utilizing enzyme [Candidatus Paceibacterota bacterium]